MNKQQSIYENQEESLFLKAGDEVEILTVNNEYVKGIIKEIEIQRERPFFFILGIQITEENYEPNQNAYIWAYEIMEIKAVKNEKEQEKEIQTFSQNECEKLLKKGDRNV